MHDVRTTTGQRVRIIYDQGSNALTFLETDWFADPLRSTAMPARSRIVRPLAGNIAAVRPPVIRLRRPGAA